MIEPLLSGDDLLADIRGNRHGSTGNTGNNNNDDNDDHGQADRDRFCLWWLGQSGFLVQWRTRHLLLDPYLSDSLTRKYADTDKPHVRMTRIPVAPEQLDFIDVVTSSHAHTDHLDGDTLRPLLQASPQAALVAPAAHVELACQRSGQPASRILPIDAGQSVETAGFHVHAVPAAHESLATDDRGRSLFLGFVVQFGPWTIYHSGDTMMYEELPALLRPWPIDVALLPINGRRPERRVAGNLWGDEAARLARSIGARLAVPCHYEMFEFNTESPELFRREAERIGQPAAVLRCGERLCSDTAFE
jgi:L-ascorbate metabolism protein UlaG (beta-lactamase superfamily)